MVAASQERALSASQNVRIGKDRPSVMLCLVTQHVIQKQSRQYRVEGGGVRFPAGDLSCLGAQAQLGSEMLQTMLLLGGRRRRAIFNVS